MCSSERQLAVCAAHVRKKADKRRGTKLRNERLRGGRREEDKNGFSPDSPCIAGRGHRAPHHQNISVSNLHLEFIYKAVREAHAGVCAGRRVTHESVACYQAWFLHTYAQ